MCVDVLLLAWYVKREKVHFHIKSCFYQQIKYNAGRINCVKYLFEKKIMLAKLVFIFIYNFFYKCTLYINTFIEGNIYVHIKTTVIFLKSSHRR